jgi:F-type H+-transporting ATPase subunit epsilon
LIHLTIVTPDRKLTDRQVEEVILPGSEGYLGVLPGHAPLLTALKVGEISYRQAGVWRYAAVAWGFAEVLADRVSVLADIAERAEDIDLDRAKKARARAEEKLKRGADVDWDRARVALEKAVVRIQVAQKAG